MSNNKKLDCGYCHGEILTEHKTDVLSLYTKIVYLEAGEIADLPEGNYKQTVIINPLTHSEVFIGYDPVEYCSKCGFKLEAKSNV